MNREECECAILQKLHEIRDIAAEYMRRDPDYITASYFAEDGSFSFNNRYWDDDSDKPLDAYESRRFPQKGVKDYGTP